MLKIKNKKGDLVAELNDEDTQPRFIKDEKEEEDKVIKKDKDEEEEET